MTNAVSEQTRLVKA